MTPYSPVWSAYQRLRWPLRHAAVLALALWASTAVQAQSTWQRKAVPYYDTVHMLQGLYGHWALPRAQGFERTAQALPPAISALCNAPTDAGQAALARARSAWQDTTLAWEQLSTLAIGPVVERRSLRSIDFAPTRPALIARAIATQPQGALAFERIGTPAKGLPALEWLLWTQPVAPGTPACRYAHEVALDLLREATALQTAYAQAAATDWGTEDQQERSAQAMSEFVNQWVGGLERLRWAHMEKPLRAAQVTRPPDYPRAASGQTLAAWNAAWAALRSATLLADSNAAPVPGSTLVPLETQLRGMGLNPLADRLRTAALRVDTALAGVAQADIHSGAQVQQTARALAVLKHLAESEVAPALKVSIGFSDADGD